MQTFGRALCGALAAASLLIGAVDATRAAGALAVGPCGAYGFAYDYAAAPIVPTNSDAATAASAT